MFYSSKSYSSNCGNTPQTACPDILTGFTIFRNLSKTDSSLTLSLAAATYTGSNNSFININIGETVSIVGSSTDPSSFPIIDLQSNSSFIIINDSVSTGDSTTTLKISNLKIINGKSSTQNGTVVNVNTKSTSTVVSLTTMPITDLFFYTDTPGDVMFDSCQFININVTIDSILAIENAATRFKNLTFTDNHATNSIINLDSNTDGVTWIYNSSLFNVTFTNNKLVGIGKGSSIYTNSASKILSLNNVSFDHSNTNSLIYCDSTSIYLKSIYIYDNAQQVISCSTINSCLVHSDGILGEYCSNDISSSDDKPQHGVYPLPNLFLNSSTISGLRLELENCGNTPQTACPDILTGLTVFRNGSNTSATSLILKLALGIYTGSNNSFININIGETVSIVGSSYLSGAPRAIIDLQSNSTFISINDAGSIGNSTTSISIIRLEIINGKSSTQNGTVVNVITTQPGTMVSLIILNAHVVNNNALGGYGGSVYFHTNNIRSYVTLRDCAFKKNTAKYGSVFYTDTPMFVSILFCQFMNNTSIFDSVLHLEHAHIQLLYTLFTDNHATNSIVTFNFKAQFTRISELKFYNNTLSSNSKGFISSLDRMISLEKADFQWNTGSTAIYFIYSLGSSESRDSNRLVIYDSNFFKNTGSKDGGAVYQSGGSSEIASTIFIDNQSLNSGGALFLSNYTDASLFNVTFTNNTAAIGGLGSSLYTDCGSKNLTLKRVSFESSYSNSPAINGELTPNNEPKNIKYETPSSIMNSLVWYTAIVVCVTEKDIKNKTPMILRRYLIVLDVTKNKIVTHLKVMHLVVVCPPLDHQTQQENAYDHGEEHQHLSSHTYSVRVSTYCCLYVPKSSTDEVMHLEQHEHAEHHQHHQVINVINLTKQQQEQVQHLDQQAPHIKYKKQQHSWRLRDR
ncbi:hypothetical protein PPL_03336 [Heterostelium album PN500]|uniref:Polymorphic outer membrane protein n=1 Tax=Heterostelium pallidum (strain ATCC 26659 / Pp 5 / PN500) TaxID=670386 RepID=D3B4L1_HETP5|nr:hypothetical protein PPL_03336 [Heterostelium album PN500]EFA84259.1 hypothetical protein PPL_03336 [Heterostelium album PN500]|eukprot:XP_020436375.1 hypothetical protein PPL_03336 [Heterostelium album PN500]